MSAATASDSRALTHVVPRQRRGMKMTPHPPSYVGHPLPRERAVICGLIPVASLSLSAFRISCLDSGRERLGRGVSSLRRRN